ncbi:hypothetical protein BAE44_0019806, partial [Dichanthelium oligosanthes]
LDWIGSRPKQVTSRLMARVVGQARHLILRPLVLHQSGDGCVHTAAWHQLGVRRKTFRTATFSFRY